MSEPERRMDSYGPEDMAIPTWTLLQKTGGDWAKSLGGKPGMFYNATTDEIADELTIIVVDILTGRARWGAEISDAGPICASMDAKSGLSLNGDDCSQCPFRLDTPWQVEAPDRRAKCCLNYTILGIGLSDYMPCIIRAHGISALPIRQLLTQLKLNRALKGEYFRATVSIKSQAKTGKYGTAYAIHPTITGLITDPTKTEELRIESNRLLGAPIPLPEGRPEDERQPLAFTPEGTPIYSEEERARALAQVKTEEPLAAATVNSPPPASKPEPEKEEQKEPSKALDLDF